MTSLRTQTNFGNPERNPRICDVLDAPGAAYVLIAQLLMGDPEGGASGEDAMDFYGLVLVSFWMSIVLLLDRWGPGGQGWLVPFCACAVLAVAIFSCRNRHVFAMQF